MRGYRTLLSKEMELAAWTEIPFWQKFIGFIDSGDGRYPRSSALGSNRTKMLRPTGKPIEVLTNFQHDGSANMDIPVAYPLTNEAIYGDNQLLGTEEDRLIAYKTCRINQVRKGVKVRSGLMGEQALKNPEIRKELMENAQAELKDFNVRWNAYAPYDTFLRRYSRNITATKANGGLAITAASHPNFYAMGYGKATWSDTPATYETNVATALTALQDSSEFHFSTKTLELAAFYAQKLKIRKVQFGNGLAYFCMVISSAQAYQLWQDEKWLTAQNSLTTKDGAMSALFTGLIEGVYRGVAVFVDQNIPAAKVSGDSDTAVYGEAYSSTYGTVNYGRSNPFANPMDISPRKIGILFGASGIVCGYASPLKFEQEEWDYKNKKTEGSHMIVGYERSDIYDYDGNFGTANLFKENTSSLVIATFSSENATF
jgi:hypothetical protein